MAVIPAAYLLYIDNVSGITRTFCHEIVLHKLFQCAPILFELSLFFCSSLNILLIP